MNLVKTSVLVAALMASSGCVTGINPGNIVGAGANLYKSATVSDDELVSLSMQLREREDKTHRVAPAGSSYAKRLDRLMANLTSVNGKPLSYKVYITNEVNANAAPDGSVRVFSGLMDVMTDDELRFVIGHEIGHVAHNHAKQKYRDAYLTAAARKAAGIYSAVGVFSNGVLGDVAENLVKSQFSQSDELEADEYGLQFLQSNGYDQNAALTCLAKLKGSGGFFSTHPSSEERVTNLRKRITQGKTMDSK